MKKALFIFFFILLLTGCSITTSTTNPIPREKTISDDLLEKLEEDYITPDSYEMYITQWFNQLIAYIDDTPETFCIESFEGDLLLSCNEDRFNIFPSDFSSLSISSSDVNPEENTFYTVSTTYSDGSNAYKFHIEINSENNRFFVFTYEEY